MSFLASRRRRLVAATLALPMAAGAGLPALLDDRPEHVEVRPDREALDDGLTHLVVRLVARADDSGGARTVAGRLAAHPGIVEARVVAPTLAAVTTELTAREVAHLPEVAGVRFDGYADVAGTISDELAGRQWAVDNTGRNVRDLRATAGADIDAAQAWGSATGDGVVVAVVDGAVQLDHPDLAGRIWTNADEDCANGVDDDRNGFVDDCRGWDFADHDALPYDPTNPDEDARHGTHVAGTIAAAANETGVRGVAPGATVMPLKVMNGGSFWTSAGAAAIRYAVDNGADIVNASWVGPSNDPVLDEALDYAAKRGVLVVAAAGNDETDIDSSRTLPASSSSPAVVTVAASDPEDQLASFSNYGPATVDLAAPGAWVASTLPGGSYGYMSGTSMAAPHVAGVAALLLGAEPELGLDRLRSTLLETADALPSLAGQVVTGARLNAARAVATVVPVPPAPPEPVSVPGEPAPAVPPAPAPARGQEQRTDRVGSAEAGSGAAPAGPGVRDESTVAPASPAPAPGEDAPAPGGNAAPAPGRRGSGTTSAPGTTRPDPSRAAPAAVGTVTIPGGTPLFGIRSISPASGPAAGGRTVTLTGDRIPAGARVLIGGTAARVVTDNAPYSITVRTPARAVGSVDVQVFGATAAERDVVANAYTYLAPSAAAAE